MLKMKLPQRKSRQQEVGPLPGALRREAVYEWFGLGLDPARRLEFACGLLGLCNPLELHFLSAYTEDLCRRDGPYLRETEGRGGVGGLLSEGMPPHREPQGDLCDPATRARLIVHLALLGDNREAAARLFRQLSAPVPAACQATRPQEREELLLVFTMASLHPAFGFHQRHTLRARLEQLQAALEPSPPRTPSPPAQDNFTHCDCMPRNGNCLLECTKSLYDGPGSRRTREAVHIEKITLKGVPRQRADKRLEYTFKVTWSDHSETSVTKSHTDLQEFLLMLPKELSSEVFDKTILRALNQGSQKREDHTPTELETVTRRLFSSASRDFLQNQKVHNFFQSLSLDPFFTQDLEQHTTVHRKCTETCHFARMKSQLATDKRNCSSNGIKQRTDSLRHIGTLKDKSLEIGSGHDTCGETSSESYSSPSSPRHERESLDSEEEKERDTDSDSGKQSRFSGYSAINQSVSKSPACISSISNGDRNIVVDPLSTSKLPPIPFMSTLHCAMHNGAHKPEAVATPPLTADMKPLIMMVTGPVDMSPMREPAVNCSPVPMEAEKRIDLLTSLPVPSPFLPHTVQTCNPSMHLSIQRMKVPSPKGLSECCAVNGSHQPTGTINIALQTAAFVPVHSPSSFPAASVAPSEQVKKPMPHAVGPNQIVSHVEGSTGTMLPRNNLKLVLPAAGHTSTSPTSHYALPGAPLATGVLPSPNTNVLNPAATTLSQPVGFGLGQVQSTGQPVVPTHTPGPGPNPSPALTHSTAQSDSTSYCNAVGNSSPTSSHLPQQQMASGTCGSCGRRCNCGTNGSLHYFYSSPIPGQVYRVPQLFTLPSLCNGSYLNQTHQSNGTQIPFFLPQAPYANGLMHDPVLGNQPNYGMQQMAGFPRFYPMYPTTNVVNTNGSGPKKNGNVSCYNCGGAGHYSHDCKQLPMDSNQQGNHDGSQRTF